LDFIFYDYSIIDMTLSWPYKNEDGELYVEQVSSMELVKEYGTPLYVYSENGIRNNLGTLKESFQKYYRKTRILYACKANTNLAILRVLNSEGAEIDAVSPGEVFLALEAGFKPEEILFTGTSVGEEEQTYLLSKGVRMNVDSVSQMSKMLDVKVPKLVSVRINPEVGAGHHEHVITAGSYVKFGVLEEDAVKAYSLALDAGVEEFGIQMHIGSGIMEVEHYINAVKKFLEIAKKVKDSVKISFEFMDLGGGIGVPYKPDEKEVDLDIFSRRLLGFVKIKLNEFGLSKPEIWLEPGRYVVADSGILLTKITTTKLISGKTFLGVDAGFNTLIRPAMYGSYHHILAASGLDQPLENYDVYGPLCESGDFFARNRNIPRVSEGEILAIMDAGAYGYSMSSQYNSRPRAAEVMVNKSEHRLIRSRETLKDLIRGQFY
jgi:diaminopimelate decarboxylase